MILKFENRVNVLNRNQWNILLSVFFVLFFKLFTRYGDEELWCKPWFQSPYMASNSVFLMKLRSAWFGNDQNRRMESSCWVSRSTTTSKDRRRIQNWSSSLKTSLALSSKNYVSTFFLYVARCLLSKPWCWDYGHESTDCPVLPKYNEDVD